MLAFKYGISFFNIMESAKIIIIFLTRFFNVILTIEKEEITKILGTKVSSLGIRIRPTI